MKFKLYSIKELSTGGLYAGGFLGWGGKRHFIGSKNWSAIQQVKFYKYKSNAVAIFTSDGKYPMNEKEFKVVEMEITINEIN